MHWEIVATFDDPIRAQMARNFLDEHGVETMLTDEETVATAWQLSNAVGGIKLLVPETDHVLAEQLLRSLERGPAPMPAVGDPTAVAATPAVAHDLAAPAGGDEIEETAAEKLADRAVKAMVIGLLMPPIQLYAAYLLCKLPSADGVLRPGGRRKVALAIALFLPLWAAAIIPLVYLIQARHDPQAPHWQVEGFDLLRHGVAVDMPNPFTHEHAQVALPAGPIRGEVYETFTTNQRFRVYVFPGPIDRLDERALLDYVNARLAAWRGGKLESWKGIEHGQFQGVEYRASFDEANFGPQFVRGQVFALGDQLVEVVTGGPLTERDNALARRFFRSVILH
jgi:hypothetical protein